MWESLVASRKGINRSVKTKERETFTFGRTKRMHFAATVSTVRFLNTDTHFTNDLEVSVPSSKSLPRDECEIFFLNLHFENCRKNYYRMPHAKNV